MELFEDAVDWVFGDDAGGVTDAIDDFFSAMPLGVRTAWTVVHAFYFPMRRE